MEKSGQERARWRATAISLGNSSNTGALQDCRLNEMLGRSDLASPLPAAPGGHQTVDYSAIRDQLTIAVVPHSPSASVAITEAMLWRRS